MDREAAVLRAEMSRTRAELDHKLVALQERMSELTPHNLRQRYMGEFFADRLVGGLLTLIGAKMAWSAYRRSHRHHRARLHAELASYSSW